MLWFLIDAPQTKCGNFVVEEGEQCDAGLNRDDRCCDDQCMFRTDVEAVCRCVCVCVCVCMS